MTMIELDQELECLRFGFTFDAEPVRDLYRAALARAEAAEALINEYHERTVAAEREASLCANALETARSRWAEAERREKSIFDDAMGIADQRDALVTRVAELEAQLAGDV